MSVSTESIGVCSLDLEAPGLSPLPKSTRLVEAASAITLRSAVLSEGASPRRQHPVPKSYSVAMDDEPDQAGMRFRSDAFLYLSNEGRPACVQKEEPMSLPLEEDSSKLPSYLGISCAISGYSSYSRFCHSRENSPARITPLKPLSLPQNNGDLKYDFSSPQFQCTKDFAQDTLKESYPSRDRSMSSDMGLSPRDSYLNSDFRRSPKESYICNRHFKSPSPEKRYVTSRNVVLNVNGSSHSRQEMTNGKAQSNGVHVNGHQDVDSVVNGVGRMSSQDWSKEEEGENKSLVERRIESLFGRPAAHVTQPSRMSRSKTRVVINTDIAKRSPSCPPQAFRSPQQESPPVFRRIAPDFKEQLRNSPAPDTSCLNKPWYGTTISPLQVYTVPISMDSTKQSANESPVVSLQEKESSERKEPETVSRKAEPSSSQQIAASELSGGHRYLKILEDERALIGQEVEEATKFLSEENLPEDALGKIRSAIGKANLMLNSKLEQFRGLCHKNINTDSLAEGEFATTTEDLAGFWDLVLLQVEDVHLTFQQIRELKRNHWKEEEKTPVPYDASSSTGAKSRRPTSSGGRNRGSKSSPTTPEHKAAKPTAAREAAKAREVQRRLLLEAKRKGRQEQTKQASTPTGDEDVEIFIPSTN